MQIGNVRRKDEQNWFNSFGDVVKIGCLRSFNSIIRVLYELQCLNFGCSTLRINTGKRIKLIFVLLEECFNFRILGLSQGSMAETEPGYKTKTIEFC